MGHAHAPGWAATGAEIAGVADTDCAGREALAAQYGWGCFDNLEQLLPEVDVVDLCVPTHLHRQMVLKAAEAGKHIFCEKPIALTIADGKAMIAACKAAGVRLFIGMVVRFFPEYIAAKSAIDAGKIGRPQVVRLTRASYRPKKAADNWFMDEAKSGGMILDLMIHDFDWARYAVGDEVERVYAKNIRSGSPAVTEDHALAILRFRGGAMAHIEGSWAYPVPRFDTRLEVAGDEGLIEWENDRTVPIRAHMHQTDGGQASDVALPGSPLDETPWMTEVKHFWDALINDKPFAVSAKDALKALQIALAARESARTGEPVTLEPLEVA
jgi:predicted dehydrogenase